MLLHPICTFFPLLQSHMGMQCTCLKFDVPNVLVLKGSNFFKYYSKFPSQFKRTACKNVWG